MSGEKSLISVDHTGHDFTVKRKCKVLPMPHWPIGQCWSPFL